MAEQSSTVAAFRALVMLICLILIPVAAFCGSSFPAVVKAVQSGRWPTLADFRGPSGPPPSNQQLSEAPRFSPTPNAVAPPADPKTSGFARGGYGAAAHEEAVSTQVVSANYNAPVAAASPRLSTSFPQGNDSGVGPNRGLLPVPPGSNNLLPLDSPGAMGHGNAPSPLTVSTSGSLPADQFKYVQERLKQLGATYYLLETCGDQKAEFRFFCRMSIGGNPRVTIPFWCLDHDPLKAMSQVLKQVEDWRSGGG